MLTAGSVFIFVAPVRICSFHNREFVPSLLLGTLKRRLTLPSVTFDFLFAFAVIPTSTVEFALELA